jgi:hypothetical protein
MPYLRALTVAAALLAAGCAFALPARGAATCASTSYAYAGLSSLDARFGASAGITLLRAPNVVNGHVAAWVGVGGPGLGPRGTDEWLQVGISAVQGEDPALYYELARPYRTPRYVMLKGHYPLGRTVHVAVLEARHRPGWWRVWVGGTPMTKLIFLPGSHGAWPPIVTAESWNGDASGTCNAFAFEFSHVRAAARPGGAWQPMQARVLADRGYRVEQARSALIALGG